MAVFVLTEWVGILFYYTVPPDFSYMFCINLLLKFNFTLFQVLSRYYFNINYAYTRLENVHKIS